MKPGFKIYNTPVLLLLQMISIMILSDIFFFILLQLIDFVHRDSMIVNVLSAKEEAIAIIMLFQILTIVYLFIRWIFHYYYFSDNMLYEKKGILFSSTKELIISEIEGTYMSQGICGKLFNFGSIKLVFAHNEVKVSRIPNPKNFIDQINNKNNKF